MERMTFNSIDSHQASPQFTYTPGPSSHLQSSHPLPSLTDGPWQRHEASFKMWMWIVLRVRVRGSHVGG
jgi:hypothetical protein